MTNKPTYMKRIIAGCNDPELVGFNGNYDGYSMPIPRSASLGLRFKF